MTEPLKNCPFCGRAPTSIVRSDDIDGTQFLCTITCYCGRYYACAYKMAIRKTPEIAKADAIAAWNTRTPQPTQAQAGAVPLTDEQIEALPLWKRFVGLWPETRREIVRTIERQHGIKGGQHGAE